MPIVDAEPVWVVSIPGRPESIAGLRRQIRARLSAYDVNLDDLLLCLTEVAANAWKHAASGRGGKIVVRLSGNVGACLVEVDDGGGSESGPRICDEDADVTHGRGLRLVNALAAKWGVRGGPQGRTVWFTIVG